MPFSVIVLAAGQGTRMSSDLPKVLQPLAGRPMLAPVLDAAEELGPDAIHVVYGHGGDAVREAFPSAHVTWCRQEPQLGTGHAVAQAMPSIPDDRRVLVLCGDVPLVTPELLRPLVDDGLGETVALLTVELDDASGYGRVKRDTDGRVVAIIEHKDASAEERAIREVNTGLMSLPAKRLRGWLERLGSDNAQGEYYLTEAVGFAIADGVAVEGIRAASAEVLIGVNDRRGLAAAERAWQRREAGRLLDGGATLADPERIDVRGELSIGRDVFIDVGCVFEGRVVLGDRVRIGPNCVVADSEIGADSTVHASSTIAASRIGSACEIGPFARLRPANELADHVKVGNFVEVKASRFSSGSKANHLSYIGDTTLGEKANVGAGTITCNYDGANKHRTVIGDEAFIGSGCMLVAPVEIGAGATIGAGSTITKDAPAGELSLARARQTNVPGWQRPVKQPK